MEARVKQSATDRAPTIGAGSETHGFCATCVFGSTFTPHGVDRAQLDELQMVMRHVGPFRRGAAVFRAGEPFRALYAVRSGVIKTVYAGSAGREYIAGFHLPGEMVGLSAIHAGRFPCDAIAVDTAYLCRFEFRSLAALTARAPAVQEQLFRLLSRDIGSAILLAGDHSADERVAAFLIRLGRRFALRGCSASEFRLPMGRRDIANHLGLAPETVSRAFGRLQQQGWIRVRERNVSLLRNDELLRLAGALLPA